MPERENGEQIKNENADYHRGHDRSRFCSLLYTGVETRLHSRVDKGLQFCYEYDIRPDYIVGDFDSLPGEILERYRQEGEIPIRTYNPVKDATDTKIALDKALEEGSTEIWILGATGTRIDHVVCNLQILKEAWEKKVPVWIVDSRNKIGLPVEKTFSLKKEEQYGTYVSLFPMGETVEGLTLKGFKYPLDHYQLKDREGLGVSNEITADVADVSWEQGVLLMIQSKD